MPPAGVEKRGPEGWLWAPPGRMRNWPMGRLLDRRVGGSSRHLGPASLPWTKQVPVCQSVKAGAVGTTVLARPECSPVTLTSSRLPVAFRMETQRQPRPCPPAALIPTCTRTGRGHSEAGSPGPHWWGQGLGCAEGPGPERKQQPGPGRLVNLKNKSVSSFTSEMSLFGMSREL